MQEIARESRQGKADVDASKAGEALAALCRNKKTEEAACRMEEDASLYRILARPRSEKYLHLIKQQIEISNRLNELYNLQQGVGITKSTDAKDDSDEMAEQGAVPDVEREESTGDSVKQNDMPGSEKSEPEKPEKSRDTIAEEIARLKEELAWIQTEVGIEMPMGHERLGFIYGSDKENRLLDMGVILLPGTPYHSEAELLMTVQSASEQEKKQWIKGDDIFVRNWQHCLVVEVYLTVICVVYEDGSVRNYRNEE